MSACYKLGKSDARITSAFEDIENVHFDQITNFMVSPNSISIVQGVNVESFTSLAYIDDSKENSSIPNTMPLAANISYAMPKYATHNPSNLTVNMLLVDKICADSKSSYYQRRGSNYGSANVTFSSQRNVYNWMWRLL